MTGKLTALIKTIWTNLRLFPLATAIRLPVIVGPKVHIRGLRRGCIVLTPPVRTKMCVLGYRNGSADAGAGRRSCLLFGGQGTLSVADKFFLANDFHMSIYGSVTAGKNVHFNHGLTLNCRSSIVIGNDCLFGWGVTLLDNDGHEFAIDGRTKRAVKDIEIGDNVWCGAEAAVLKGTHIRRNSIIGYGTVVSGEYPECAVISPPRNYVLQHNEILWHLDVMSWDPEQK